KAIGYVETHWDGRQGAPNDFGQYGVMGLRVSSAVPGGIDRGTLPVAAALLGLPPAALQSDAGANIRGAAALLHLYAAGTAAGPAGDPSAGSGQALAAWYPIVAR